MGIEPRKLCYDVTSAWKAKLSALPQGHSREWDAVLQSLGNNIMMPPDRDYLLNVSSPIVPSLETSKTLWVKSLILASVEI